MSSNRISVIIPVYNALETLDELIDQCEKNLKNITQNFEIILVDDYSSDNSWKKIQNIAEKNSSVKGLKLVKNFGVDTAITEGLKISSGNYVFVVTCDITDPLNQMSKLYEKLINKNVDVVCSYYENKHPESLISKFFSRIYWKLFSFLINENYPVEEGLYRVISRKAVDIYLANTNKFKHIKVMHTYGIKKDYVIMRQSLRKFGNSGFHFRKKMEFAIDYITTYSYRPLIYSSMFGFFLSILFMLTGV